jgi:hypothetical protein
MKKIIVFLAGVLCLSTFVFAGTSVYAEVNEENTSTLSTDQTKQLAEVLTGHLGNQINNGQKEVVIIDPEGLQLELDSISSPISYEELVDVVNNFNYYIKAENGDGPISDMVNTPIVRARAINCSTVMAAIGAIHAGSYAVAASLLGITGPAAAIVPVVVGLAYQLGSLLC